MEMVKPEEVGLSGERLARIDAHLRDRYLGPGKISGALTLVARHGKVAHCSALGHMELEQRRPLEEDAIFRIYSMTKPITSIATMMLYEKGLFQLRDPVHKFIPAFRDMGVFQMGTYPAFMTEPAKRPMRIKDLLSHTSGLTYGFMHRTPVDAGYRKAGLEGVHSAGNLEEVIEKIAAMPLEFSPGDAWNYSMSTDVLGYLVHVVSGKPFDQFLQRRIFTPLGMTSTRYLRPLEERAGMATLYTQDENQDLVRVEGRDPGGLSWTPGGSGLVSTAGDYLRFALMLWNRGSYAGVRILAPETVAMMTHPHVTSGVLRDMGMEGLGWGLGIAVVVDPDATPMTDREGDFWWSGYYGTTFFVSPTTGLTGVVLAQNQPGPFSRRPYAVYLAQAFAFFGL